MPIRRGLWRLVFALPKTETAAEFDSPGAAIHRILAPHI